jgi:hypothetical protein
MDETPPPAGRDIATWIAELAREAEEAEANADPDAPIPHHCTITRGPITVRWSEPDQEWVATTSEFPSLSWLEEDPFEAEAGLRKLVVEVRADLAAEREE